MTFLTSKRLEISHKISQELNMYIDDILYYYSGKRLEISHKIFWEKGSFKKTVLTS